MFILCLKSSHAMGMGHLFRMINLYGALRQNGVDATIVLLGEHPPSSEWLQRAGIPFEVVTDQAIGRANWEAGLALRYGAKVWVNDRLQTDADHAIRIKELGLRLVTFDDLGSGAALADIHVTALSGVRGETPQGAKVLMGLKYLILPPEIARFRRQRTECKSWVVSLGGSDTYGVTVMVAQWLSARQQHATLILGPGFSHEEALAKVMDGSFTVKRSVPSLIAEFAGHDLAITGGGLTAFEAAAAGLPTVTVANEVWEVAHCLHLQALGCSLFAGPHKNIDLSMLEEPLDIANMSVAALHAVDTNGVNQVCHEMMTLVDRSRH
jgi:spore coat polysaccharide biosynthesis predicted glycosyltransferase SpsG